MEYECAAIEPLYDEEMQSISGGAWFGNWLFVLNTAVLISVAILINALLGVVFGVGIFWGFI